MPLKAIRCYLYEKSWMDIAALLLVAAKTSSRSSSTTKAKCQRGISGRRKKSVCLEFAFNIQTNKMKQYHHFAVHIYTCSTIELKSIKRYQLCVGKSAYTLYSAALRPISFVVVTGHGGLVDQTPDIKSRVLLCVVEGRRRAKSSRIEGGKSYKLTEGPTD